MPRVGLSSSAGTLDNTGLIVSVLNQGGLGSCELNGWDNSLRASECVQLATAMAAKTGMPFQQALIEVLKAPPELASRLAMYFGAQAVGGYVGKGDTGTCSADVMLSFSQIGFCRESAYPYTDDVTKIDPGNRLEEIKRLSYDQRFDATARIDSDSMSVATCEAAIRQALAALYVLPYAGPVDTSFENLRAGEIWRGCVGKVLGGHCTDIVGIGPANELSPYATSSEVVLKFVNSWSEGYADGGFYLVALSALVERYDICATYAAPLDSGTVDA